MFVPNFVRIGVPPNRKLQKDQLATFDTLADDELAALPSLQDQLTSPRVLTLARSEDACTVESDACDRQVGLYYGKCNRVGTKS